MYELINKIENYEIQYIMRVFYTDLKLSQIFKDDIDFKDTPFKNYDYDKAIKDLKKLVKFIIKNQKKEIKDGRKREV